MGTFRTPLRVRPGQPNCQTIALIVSNVGSIYGIIRQKIVRKHFTLTENILNKNIGSHENDIDTCEVVPMKHDADTETKEKQCRNCEVHRLHLLGRFGILCM